MKTFRNDKERIAFLEGYRNTENGWTLWKHDDDLGRCMWRLNLSDGSYLVAEEELTTISWPKPYRAFRIRHWYIVEPGEVKPFADWRGSRTQALEKLKELGRKK